MNIRCTDTVRPTQEQYARERARGRTPENQRRMLGWRSVSRMKNVGLLL